MFINKIDELVNNILDDFYENVINKNLIPKEIEFIKLQKQINNILIAYFNDINDSIVAQISQNVIDKSNVNQILELIKKYVQIYVFLFLGFQYEGKHDTYVNNIIEYSKNQPAYALKINNFFQSESNQVVIKIFDLMVDMEKNRSSPLKTEFTKKYNKEFIETLFNSDPKIYKSNMHDIIKLLIFDEVYISTDKEYVQEILEQKELQSSNYTHIWVVISDQQQVDYEDIVALFTPNEINQGMADDLYNMIIEDQYKNNKTYWGSDHKVEELFKRSYFIPIVEDFLLFHKNSEIYVTNVGKATNKEFTKIKYIINKIEIASDRYNADESIKNLDQIFNPATADRDIVLINTYENLRILNKIININTSIISNNEYFNDLVDYQNYHYINYKNLNRPGFSLLLSEHNTLDAYRYINFKSSNKRKIPETRTAYDNNLNVVGVIIPSKTLVNCNPRNKISNIDDINKTINNYNTANKIMNDIVINDKKITPIYWLFDKDKDKYVPENYEIADNQTLYKNMIASFYDNLLLNVFNFVSDHIKKNKINFHQYNNILHFIDKNVISYQSSSQIVSDLLLQFWLNGSIKYINEYDTNNDIFYGFGANVINIPEITPDNSNNKMSKIVIGTRERKGFAMTKQLISSNYICQHEYTWDKIMRYRKIDPTKFSDQLFGFIQQYAIKNYEGEYICKSCNKDIHIKNYVLDGSFNNDGKFITLTTTIEIPLEDLPEYSKYKTTIKNLEKIIDRIATITNMEFLKGLSLSIIIKDRIIKKI